MKNRIAATCLIAVTGFASSFSQARQTSDPDEIRAVVSEMLSDAETRTSLLTSDAGHQDGKFFISSDDGAYSLTVWGMLQFRYLLDFRDDTATDDGFESGFQTRRTKLGFKGNIVSKAWTYTIQTDFSRSSGNMVLDDAYVDYKFDDNLRLRWGQFKLPLLREELVSDQNQLAVERSVMNSVFTQARSQGVAMYYETGTVGAAFAFSDGLNSLNSDFTAPGGLNFIAGGESDWAVTSRVEIFFSGVRKDLSDFTSPQGAAFLAMLGFAGHYQQSPNTAAPGQTDRDLFEYTADLTFKGDGWNAFGAFVGRMDSFRAGGSDTDFNDFGGLIQGGLRVAKDTELFARWDAIFADGDRALTEDNFHFVTFGVTHFFAGHAAQFTADAVVSLSDTPDLTALGVLPNTGIGLLGNTESGEVVARFQFQLLF